MTKIVINTCFGGFSISDEAVNAYLTRKGLDPQTRQSIFDLPRDDADLVAVVESLGRAADGPFAELSVVEIPDDVEWQIEEYDGAEHIAEAHRTWP